MHVPEVEWFESNFPGTSLHFSGHLKVKAGIRLSFGSSVKQLPQIRTFLAIKMALVQFGDLLSTRIIELWMCASLLDYLSQGTRHQSRLSIQDYLLESAP